MTVRSSKSWSAVKLISAFALGLFASSQIFNLNTELYLLLPGILICILAAFFAIGFILEKLFKPALERTSKKTASIAILLSLLAGFYLVLTIPLTVFPKPQTFRIVATGEKNLQAKSSQVWLTKLSSGESNLLPLNLMCKGPWSRMDSALVSLQENQPATLVCTIETTDDILLEFVKHPWSGEMRLFYGSEKIEQDLYSPENSGMQIRLPVHIGRGDQIFWLLLFVADGISIAILLLALLLFLKDIPSNPVPSGGPCFGWLGYAFVPLLIWIFMLLVFWPGFFSPDTVDQFTQIESRQFSDWHPVFHTLFLLLTTRLAFSPVPADLVQMIAFSLLIGWGLSVLRQEGMPRWAAWITIVFFAFSPAIAAFLLNPWKDTAFSIAILFLTLLLLFLFHSRERGKPVGFEFWAALVLCSVSVSLFRHNGGLVAFGTLALLFIAVPSSRRAIFFTLVASAVLWVFIKGPLYSFLNVDTRAESSGENLVAYSQLYYLLRYHQDHSSILAPQTKQLLTAVHFDDGRIRIVDLASLKDELLRQAILTSLRNPLTTLKYFLDRSSFVFQILQPPLKFFGYVEMKVYPNNWGILSESKFPELKLRAEKLVYLSEQPWFDWLLWRNGFWMDLVIFAVVIASLRKGNWVYLILAAPLLLNALPYVFIAQSQARYLLPTLLVGPLLGLGLPFVRKWHSSHKEVSEADPDSF